MGKASREKKLRKMLPSIMAEIAGETKVFGCGPECPYDPDSCPFEGDAHKCPWGIEQPELTAAWQEECASLIAEERLRGKRVL